MALYCDKREHLVTQYLTGRTGVKLEHLVRGDYAIKVGDRLVAVFERKSLDDFGASILDGRSTNKQNLIDLRKETGCLVYYIIEGPFRPSDDAVFGKIKYSVIRESIARLQAQHAFNIIRTQNTKHTAEELLNLQKAFLRVTPFEGDTQMSLEQLYEVEDLNPDDVLKMKNERSVEQKRVEIWTSLTAFGPATAIKMAGQPPAYWLSNPEKADFLMPNQKISFGKLFDVTWNNEQGAFLGKLKGVGPKKLAELMTTYKCLCEACKCVWIGTQLI